MGMEDAGLTCGAVCVYPSRVAECVAFLKQYGAEQVHSLIYLINRFAYSILDYQDPWHVGTDPDADMDHMDPVFWSVTFKMPTKNNFFL
jgi:hypothetical protein